MCGVRLRVRAVVNLGFFVVRYGQSHSCRRGGTNAAPALISFPDAFRSSAKMQTE